MIASGMRSNLLLKAVPASKVEVIPNFVDIGEFKFHPKDNAFSRGHAVFDKFVVSYEGTWEYLRA